MGIASNASKLQIFTDSTTTYNLPVPADYVADVNVVQGGSTKFEVSVYTADNTSASSTNVQFKGKPGAPASTLTFETAPASGSLILANYIPAGSL